MRYSTVTHCRPSRKSSEAFVRRLAIRYNFIWVLFGNLFASATQVGILCLLAKLCSVHTVGQYALALALINPVFALYSLHLRIIQVSDIYQRRSFGTYFAVRLITNGMALATILVLGLVDSEHSAILYVVVALTLSKLFVATSDILYGLMQRCERMDCIAKSQILSGSAQLLVFSIAIILTNSLVFASFCTAVVTLMTLFLYDLSTASWLHSRTADLDDHGRLLPDWNLDRIKRLVWLALPPGIMVGVVSLTISLPRGFIAQFVDTSAVGIFVALLCPGIVLQQTVMALAQATLPRLSQYYVQRNASAFRRLLVKVLAVNALAGLIGLVASLLVGRQLLSFLFRAEFAIHFDAFIWIMVSCVINCLVAAGNVLTAAGRFRTQLAIALVSLVVMVSACTALVPSFGILGAAISLVIVAIVRLTLISVYVTQVVIGLRPRQESPVAESELVGALRVPSPNSQCLQRRTARQSLPATISSQPERG